MQKLTYSEIHYNGNIFTDYDKIIPNDIIGYNRIIVGQISCTSPVGGRLSRDYQKLQRKFRVYNRKNRQESLNYADPQLYG